MNLKLDTLNKARKTAEQRLMDMRNADGFWPGRLSSSALAAAVACVALYQVDPKGHHEALQRGWQWLAAVQNSDGGWGDTPESKSNLSTTLLVWAAFQPVDSTYATPVTQAESYISAQTQTLSPDRISKAILRIYGDDKTFSAPILALCALAGRLGPDPACWHYVPQLPLEAAALPQGLFRFLQLPVVSYAIPALIGIGLLRHRRGRATPLWGKFRDRITPRLLNELQALQPENGGFLEATPLAAFVALSLAGAGEGDHPVTRNAIEFILTSQLEDGSWPIDTDLATWVSTLSIKALEEHESTLPKADKAILHQWLSAQQFTTPHPFTGAAPGGWAWTHWAGAVPDADDTAGALLALHHLSNRSADDIASAKNGIQWLMGLQNRDGGIPTFCKGWGTLPFDKSCADLTGHALRAFLTWQDAMPAAFQRKMDRRIKRMIDFLIHHQHGDGFWLPLWFGHQQAADERNPVYGTVQVLLGLSHPALAGRQDVQTAMAKAVEYLQGQQNDDGGWGGQYGVTSSIEETALALSALAENGDRSHLERGSAWLLKANENKMLASSPIGLYFASLWYDERMYPAVFTAQALRRLYFSQLNRQPDIIKE